LKPANEGIEIAAQGRREVESGAVWQEIKRDFLASGDVAALHSALTRFVEAAVVEAYRASEGAGQPPAALLAFGGFARGELFPYSHPDILVVREDGQARTLPTVSSEFSRQLWTRGVRPHQRVVTIANCLAPPDRNADFAFRLLDRRVIAGDARLANQLDCELSAYHAKYGGKIAEQLAGSTRLRHSKFGYTASHREPDILNGPGGVHDLRVTAALIKLCADQATLGGIPGRSASFVSFVRAFLHYHAGDDRNLLDAAAQEAITAQFAPGSQSAEWMRSCFQHLRACFQATRRTLDLCVPDNNVPGAADRQGASDPEFEEGGNALRLLEYIARNGIAPAAETEQRLRDEGLPGPLGWSEMKLLFSCPYAAMPLRVLEATGLLGPAIPEWTRIECLIPANADDVYTLDEQTLRGIERVCELRRVSDASRQRFAQLLPEGEDQAPLMVALLLRHMEEHAAREAATRARIPETERDFVLFLVAARGSFLDAVGGRDLDDPATVRSLAERVGTIEQLRALTILAYADLMLSDTDSAVPWRLDQLWGAYESILRELTRELESDRIEAIPADLVGSSEFIRGFPTRYLRARSAEEVRTHIQLYEGIRSGGVSVRLEPVEGAYRLTVMAHDRAALFASLAGAISSFGLNIVRAEAYSNSKGIILDTFVVTDPKRTLSLNPPEAERLQDLMVRIAKGKTDARRLFRNRTEGGTGASALDARIHFDSEACEKATLVEIVAADRPGLLYSLANVFSSNRCDIDTVLIDTKGRRAIDVFYVASEGRKLSTEFQTLLERQLLAACAGANIAA
jgi:[protein-PII] uridylyltransferase